MAVPMHDQAKHAIDALTGLRVLDFAAFIAAPYAATLMAEYGADVVKVKLPGSGDPTRRLGSMTEAGETLPWLSEARNKRFIALDLRTAEGAVTLKRLIAVADVVCENFQLGTLEAWRVGWERGHRSRRAPPPSPIASPGSTA